MENQKVRYGRVFFISFMISAIICGSYLYYIGSQCHYSSGNLNSQEAQAQNNQFEAYFGEHVSAIEVKQLLSLVRSNNITGKANDEDKTIYINGKLSTTGVDIKSGSYYKVEVANNKAVKPSSESSAEPGSGADIPDEQKAGYYDNGFIRNISITPVENIESNTSNGIVNSTVSNQSSYNNTIYSNSLNEVN